MAYTLTYRQRFIDIDTVAPAQWEILYNKKDGPVVEIVDLVGSASPLSIEWSNTDQDKFTPIIGSKATIGYVYQGLPGEPIPKEFIDVEEDTWLIIINKNGALHWKGFVKPDNNNYPFVYPPYEFKMNATDYFQAMKSITVDLNDPVLFKYTHITLKEVIDRSLFHAVVYDDAVLKVLCSLSPDAISAPSALFDEVYIHTDAFYDFEDGAMSVYDCLTNLCQTMGMRMFYSGGSYWMQRVADLDQQEFTVYELRPNTDIEIKTVVNVVRQLGTSSPQNDMYYTGRTQNIYVTPALKKQEFDYKLKGINLLANFDWRNFTGSQFPGWGNAGSGLDLSRRGAGSIEDPYIARMAGGGDPSLGQILAQTFTVFSGQHIEINVKGLSYYTTGLRVNVALGPVSAGARSYFMDSGGDWKQDDVIPTTYQEILLTPAKKTGEFSGKLTSSAIPGGYLQYNLFFNIVGPSLLDDPQNPKPPSNPIYNEVYPVFLRIFGGPYTDFVGTITNDLNYSQKPDKKEFFFLDTRDSRLSNTLFYNPGTIQPLPPDNWASSKDGSLPKRTIDAHLGWAYLDARQSAVSNIQGDVSSNSFEFHNVVKCVDVPGTQFMVLRDKYDVRDCRHSLMIAEVMKEGTATGKYEVKPITDN